MGPVSVYRVVAERGEPAHVFGGGACDLDPGRAAWLGWLPLEIVDWVGPDVAVAGDRWLTGPAGRSKSGPVVPGDVVTVDDAAGELAARRGCGLAAFTDRPAVVPAAGRFRAQSVAVAVADDLAARVAGLRAAHDAWIASLGAADEESRLFDACGYGPAGDSPAGRGCARTLRDLEEARLRLHVLLDAAVRVGIFHPADSTTASPFVGALAPAGGRGDAAVG